MSPVARRPAPGAEPRLPRAVRGHAPRGQPLPRARSAVRRARAGTTARAGRPPAARRAARPDRALRPARRPRRAERRRDRRARAQRRRRPLPRAQPGAAAGGARRPARRHAARLPGRRVRRQRQRTTWSTSADAGERTCSRSRSACAPPRSTRARPGRAPSSRSTARASAAPPTASQYWLGTFGEWFDRRGSAHAAAETDPDRGTAMRAGISILHGSLPLRWDVRSARRARSLPAHEPEERQRAARLPEPRAAHRPARDRRPRSAAPARRACRSRTRCSVERIIDTGFYLVGLLDEVAGARRDELRAGRARRPRAVRPSSRCSTSWPSWSARWPAPRARRSRSPASSRGAAAIEADRRRLTQMLLNLLSNAIKYGGPDGRVRLSAARVDDRVEICGQRQRARASTRTACSDLFEPFERLGAEAGPAPGSGIGLALSKRIAESTGARAVARAARRARERRSRLRLLAGLGLRAGCRRAPRPRRRRRRPGGPRRPSRSVSTCSDASATRRSRSVVVGQQPLRHLPERLGVARAEAQADGLVARHDLAQAAGVGDQARAAGRHRLERDQPERLVDRRHDGQVGDPVERVQHVVADPAEERAVVVQAERARLRRAAPARRCPTRRR